MSRRVDKEEAAHLQYETEHTEPPKSRSVMLYMGILIAAAFLLLLVAYFMQQRTASTVQDLQNGLNSFQTIDQLVDDNQALRDEVERLKDERDTLEQNLAATQAQLDEANQQLFVNSSIQRHDAQKLDALNKLNQIRALYNDGRYKEAKAVLKDCDPGIETTLQEITQDDLTSAELDIYDPLASYQRFVRLLT